jgi:hypothetical protein
MFTIFFSKKIIHYSERGPFISHIGMGSDKQSYLRLISAKSFQIIELNGR